MPNPIVGIIMGSDSDLDIMSQAAKLLDDFGIANEMRIVSAHRTPVETTRYVTSAAGRGIKVIIVGAGGSAHLGGVTAAQTNLPVISIPVKREGHDHEALWSNVALPPGIPIATMPENGHKNAALLAVRILALSDKGLADKYAAFVKKQHDDVIKKDQELNKK